MSSNNVSTNNSINPSSSAYTKFKPNVKISLAVIGSLILIFLLYWFVFRNRISKIAGLKKETLIPYLHDGKIEKTINDSKIPDSSQGNEYNINFWLFINDYSYKYNDKKIIFYKGDRNNVDESNPFVYLMPKENTLVVQIGLQTETSNQSETIRTLNQTCGYSSGEGYVGHCAEKLKCLPSTSQDGITNNICQLVEDSESIVNNIEGFQGFNKLGQDQVSPNQDDNMTSMMANDRYIRDMPSNQSEQTTSSNLNVDYAKLINIPLQRWCNINISISNSTLDIYLNGKLTITKILRGFPKINKGSLRICPDGGLNGYISGFVFSNKLLPDSEIMSSYESGPSYK